VLCETVRVDLVFGYYHVIFNSYCRTHPLIVHCIILSSGCYSVKRDLLLLLFRCLVTVHCIKKKLRGAITVNDRTSINWNVHL
jgi:hypothetical protein